MDPAQLHQTHVGSGYCKSRQLAPYTVRHFFFM